MEQEALLSLSLKALIKPADFEPEKLKQSVTKAAKAVFGIKDKEADKVGQALTKAVSRP